MTLRAYTAANPLNRSGGTAPIYVMLVFVMLLWAGNSIVARAVRDQMPPFSLALFRWSGATAILLPLALRYLRADLPVVRKHWPMILILGILGVGCFNAFLYSGLRYTTATNGLLMQAAIPPLVLFADLLFFLEWPPRLRVVGCLFAFAGVAVIVFHGDPSAVMGLKLGTGELLILSGVVAWSAYTSLMRQRPPVHALTFLSMTFVIGILAMLPLAIVDWSERPMVWSASSIMSVAYVAVLPSTSHTSSIIMPSAGSVLPPPVR